MAYANQVKTPLEPGVRDCPAVINDLIQAEYRAIVGHISFMVMMTRPDLDFALVELSKFGQNPGQ
eukprot:2766702-Rhodomonas_salina.2